MLDEIESARMVELDALRADLETVRVALALKLAEVASDTRGTVNFFDRLVVELARILERHDIRVAWTKNFDAAPPTSFQNFITGINELFPVSIQQPAAPDLGTAPLAARVAKALSGFRGADPAS